MVARPEEVVVTLHWASLHALDDSIELPDLESLWQGGGFQPKGAFPVSGLDATDGQLR